MRIDGSFEGLLKGRTTEALSGLQASTTQSAVGQDDEKAANAFETYFSTLLVKELRRALPEGMFSGAGSDVYTAWFDEHIGETLAKRDTLGIAGMIRTALARTAEAASAPNEPGGGDAGEGAGDGAGAGERETEESL